MTKDLCARMRYEHLEQAYAAYTALAMIYEDTCGGPYKAREFKEYFAIMDSRDNIRQEVTRRAEEVNHGEQ